MNVSIFIKSYKGDFEWLSYCLRSIHKYVTGHSEVVVALPGDHGLTLTKERIVIADEWPDEAKPGSPSRGYYHQMYVKMCADLYCPDADYILIVDSDCVFTRPFDVSELFHDGKPMLLCREWKDAGGGIIWKKPAEDALGFECTHDTMCCHPAIYNAQDLAGARAYIAKKHYKPFEQYVRSSERFIEFVTIGNYILQYARKAYHVVNMSEKDIYPRPLKQSWSWGGLTPEIQNELEEVLK